MLLLPILIELMGWTQVVVDTSALASNIRLVRRRVKGRLYAVVKSNAYGHGMLECSRVFLEGGADALAVFFPREGVVLRQAGVDAECLLLGGFWPEEVEAIFDHFLTPAVGEWWQVEALEKEAAARRTPIGIHVKVDTGMGRLGFLAERVPDLVRRLRGLRWVKVEGVMSHFPVADEEDQESRAFTRKQIELFGEVTEAFSPLGVEVAHIANSAGVFFWPEAAFDGARVGIALYGGMEVEGLKQAMCVRTRLASVKEVPAGWSISYGRTFVAPHPMRIGVIPCGYATGYPRWLSNRASVWVGGKRVRVLGRVCMDLTVIDLTGVKARVGDWVYLLGPEGGISVFECAAWMETITYEVFCLFSAGASSILHL